MPIAHLPKAATSFVGRAEELANIADLLANPECRLLTLVGPGGIGKTRIGACLLLALAHQNAPQLTAQGQRMFSRMPRTAHPVLAEQAQGRKYVAAAKTDGAVLRFVQRNRFGQ